MAKPPKNIKLHHNTIDIMSQLDTASTRLINSALFTQQRKRLVRDTFYDINLHKFMELNGLEEHKTKAFNLAVEAAKSLRDLSITIELPEGGYLYTSLVFQIKVDEPTLLICWNPDFIPFISGSMPSGTFFHPAILMSSVPHQRYSLYLLLERSFWELDTKEKKVVLTRDLIRTTLNKPDTLWKEITRGAIKPAIADIEEKLGKKLLYRLTTDTVEFTLQED